MNKDFSEFYENLVEDLDENNKIGQLLLKDKKDLTQEELKIVENKIEEFNTANYIPIEESMKEFNKLLEELEEYERISNSSRRIHAL